MSKMIPFYKGHGTGNDFVIFLKNECFQDISNPSFIEKICNRRMGIGADGVIIISDISSNYFKMDYYNSDGSWETFCANGSRCVGKLLSQKRLIEKKANFTAGDGEHQLKFDDSGDIWIKMKSPSFVTDEISLFGFSGKHVDSGAKHFACKTENLSNELVQEFGPKIRFSEEFSPDGLNVNFVKWISENEIEVITYEKGIEKVMLSCGSGAVATAYYLNNFKQLSSPLKINVPGGELNLKFNKFWDDVWLGGPAVILFKSEINLRDYD